MMTNAPLTTAIQNVHIVDDDPDSRGAYADFVRLCGLKPIREPGPYANLEDVLASVNPTNSAFICDYNLKQRQYATFKGAKAIKLLYEKRIPAILCTRYGTAEIDEIRKYRRWVPVLISPDDMDSDAILNGFQMCMEEFEDKLSEQRKPWRTMIRVDDVDSEEGILFAVIPGWNAYEVVKLFMSELTEPIRTMIADGKRRFWAKVNVGAEKSEELFIIDWEE